jgi:adenylate cyclase
LTINYNGLSSTYWQKQKERVSDMVNRLRQQSFTKEGRDIPDPNSSGSLAIGEGRRIMACVMFLDICGFSKRPMETPVEQDLMLRIISLFFSEMIRIAEEFDGQVEKNTGDGLMIYFSDDSGASGTTAVHKALACALTMQAATTHLINPVVKESNSEEIRFRISMDYGSITVAKIGASHRFSSFAAIGATANFASKMLKFASEDQIILGDSAKKHIPIDWQIQWTEPLPINTGWHYLSTGNQYSIHLYKGRWAKLI